VTFSITHIGVTALLVGLASVPVALALLRPDAAVQAASVAVITGLTTFGWRVAANVDAMNSDGVNWVSANDVLAGFLVYLTLGMYASFAPPRDVERFERLRVALAVAAIVVNVLAI
jgi:hypothetical protein